MVPYESRIAGRVVQGTENSLEVSSLEWPLSRENSIFIPSIAKFQLLTPLEVTSATILNYAISRDDVRGVATSDIDQTGYQVILWSSRTGTSYSGLVATDLLLYDKTIKLTKRTAFLSISTQGASVGKLHGVAVLLTGTWVQASQEELAILEGHLS